jgi:hypothetical protein
MTQCLQRKLPERIRLRERYYGQAPFGEQDTATLAWPNVDATLSSR